MIGPVDHPTYILQWIRLGSSEILVFYDRGASVNLIQGEIAEREGLPVVCSIPGKVRVGGGLEIDTVYGVYRVSLGPNEEGEYLEITCIGLPVLTEQFSEHFLEEFNKEVYRMGVVSRAEPLPKTLGGASVGLLMGITSTKTDPVLVHTFSNGLGNYRTPFIDRDGSQLAYGGLIKFSLGVDPGAITSS